MRRILKISITIYVVFLPPLFTGWLSVRTFLAKGLSLHCRHGVHRALAVHDGSVLSQVINSHKNRSMSIIRVFYPR